MTVKLVELQTFNKTVKEEIVADIEELLEKAKKGEFDGFAWSAGLPSGTCTTGYTKCVSFHVVLSGLAILQHRMITGHVEEAVKDDETD